MLITVFSDSHGRTSVMREALARYAPEQVIFLGDGIRDIETLEREFPRIPFLILRGNCDWDDREHMESALVRLGGVQIFAAHGHRHGVKTGLGGFYNSVCCSGSALGLYGHTHQALIQSQDGVTLMNPGSAGDRVSPSFGLVRIENGAFSCEIIRPE